MHDIHSSCHMKNKNSTGHAKYIEG
uniref:Uncharacterized protein n=1 Tax=Arundo donax TaxID=35708 RepID=A0A0A9BCW9_ARUDO